MGMDNLFESITKYIKDNHMLEANDGVIVGLSGGADSVCLLSLLVRYRDYTGTALVIRAVHVNHMIRGNEADEDQDFVEKLCRDMNVECSVYTKNIPEMAKEMNLTEEEAGRIYRYQVFEEEAEKLEKKAGISGVKIAVAHNKNDLAETVIYNMIRGSSLLGLAGIKPVRGRIIRPLLMTFREEIEAYDKENGLEYRTDSTNMITDYSRNKIRLEVLPKLMEINDGAIEHIAMIAAESTELKKDIDKEVAQASEDSFDKGISISELSKLSELAKGEKVLSYMESICGRRKDITREHISSVVKLANKESGKRVDLPYGMVAEKVYDRVVISRSGDRGIEGSSGEVTYEKIPYAPGMDISKKEYTKMIDYDKIKSVLCFRTPEPDDYMVINSEGGTKKIYRILSAEKVERARRDSFPVVADGNEIVWAVGLRLSERYKIDESTKNVLVMNYISKDLDVE